jgi:hypothetical protein
MNPLLRRLLGPYMDTNDGEGNDLGGGSTIDGGQGNDTGTGGGDDTITGAAGDDTIDGGEKKDGRPIEAQMLDAISKGVGKDEGEDTVKGAAAAAPKPKAGEKVPAKEAETPEAKETREKAERAAIRAKKPDDFKLSAEDRKALGAKASIRFSELSRYGREQFERAEELTQRNVVLEKTRDEIFGIFSEYKIENGQELTPLLELHHAMKERRWEDALAMVEDARAGILTVLHKEAPGVDLLKEFPDLSKRVEEQDLTREDALALAKARRVEAQHKAGDTAAQQEERQQQQITQARNAAADSIDQWCAAMAKSDIDYKAKEATIMAKSAAGGASKLQQIMRDYPPDKWLPTLKLLYDGIKVEKTTPGVGTDNTGLRPNGARGGAKVHTQLTPNALAESLGYSQMPE